MDTYLIYTFSPYRVPKILVMELEAIDIIHAIQGSGVPVQEITKVELKTEYMRGD